MVVVPGATSSVEGFWVVIQVLGLKDLGMKVLKDQGILVVVILDGKRRVRMGTRQAAGKQKARAGQKH